jgi:hypothetical protein
MGGFRLRISAIEESASARGEHDSLDAFSQSETISQGRKEFHQEESINAAQDFLYGIFTNPHARLRRVGG